jgi:RNA polymerase sigma-70 factor (ECF subfamily)
MELTESAVTAAPPERRGFDDLVRAGHRRLLAYALALTHRNDAAEDLVQDALLVAHRDLARFDAARDFGAWVRGILRMKYLEWVRRRRLEALPPDVLDAVEATHRAWDRAVEESRVDALEAVRDCLRLLSAQLGDAVDGFYTRNLSCAEIAAAAGTTEIVVRKRLQRARESLADCVRRKTGGTP